MISSIPQLYKAFDVLLEGISVVCTGCTDDDCKGFVWVLPEEEGPLLDAGASILTVNNQLAFLNPFDTQQAINVEQPKPDCLHCLSRQCTIRDVRPLVCRMYPLNFAIENGKVYLVLHLDCQFARQVEHDYEFRTRAIDLFRDIHRDLLSQMVEIYRKVHAISKFPDGPNRYLILSPVEALLV